MDFCSFKCISLLAAICFACATVVAGHSTSNKPNFVFIMTDDQDLKLSSVDYMPNVLRHMGQGGTFFSRHYCTIAVCCPSRVSLLTGKMAHNTNVTDVQVPYGGYPKFISEGLNDKYLPVWLQQAGYNTYYTGKLMNAHSTSNYNNPYPAGFNGSDFLIDPGTYVYWNATFQRNQDPRQNFPGQYNTDLVAQNALGFLDDAYTASKSTGRPFFLGITPIAPHSEWGAADAPQLFTIPKPATRHQNLFPDVVVPRTYNFNPQMSSGVSWMSKLPQLNETETAYGDLFYRSRLQSLQAVDELVDDVFQKLEQYGLLNNTYIIYTTDNGYHIGQHRLKPGKTCIIEEDINIPFFIRGPGVPKGKTVDFVSSHTDIVPTLFHLAGIELHSDFDGHPMPVTKESMEQAKTDPRRDHVGIEYWGLAVAEGNYANTGPGGTLTTYQNNTYKSMRVIGDGYDLTYSVWCTNEHELYDMKNDPGQMNNLATQMNSTSKTILNRPLAQLQSRLDALLMVLKSCKGSVCVYPWKVLHPDDMVANLQDAIHPMYDDLYSKQPKVSYESCELGYILEKEGPQDVLPMMLNLSASWADWT